MKNFIIISIVVILKDIYFISGDFKNIYLRIIDILITLFVVFFSIITMLALASINSNGKIEISELNIFLIFSAIFSILKLIFIYIIKGKFYLKVFFIVAFTLIGLLLLYMTLNL
jgi:hypothetical protein